MLRQLLRHGPTPRELLRKMAFTAPDQQLSSCLCTQEQLASPRFQYWANALKVDEGRLHRKLWEYCFIAEALDERGLLRPGLRGLGFAVGTEPLASLFVSRGVAVVASDMDPEEAAARGWVETNQHAGDLDVLNQRGICPADMFDELCSFVPVDMNRIPPTLTGFDFLWSSCAIEHLGSLYSAANFVLRAMDCLKPGGVAVHTTEYNVSSNDGTVSHGDTVLFRRRDLEDLARRLRRDGHHLHIDYTRGRMPGDRLVDTPPYTGDVHLKLKLGEYVVTSMGLIITKAG